MSIERGIKRMCIALSVLIVALLAWDASPTPYTVFTFWCDPAHKFSAKTHMSEKYILGLSTAALYREFDWPTDYVPEGCTATKTAAGEIQFPPKSFSYETKVERYWVQEGILPFLKHTAITLGIIWGLFYTTRWIARGFAGRS